MAEARNTVAAGDTRLLRQGQEGTSRVARQRAPAPLALARALTAVLQPSAAESQLGESFAYAMASVEAELGLLVSVRAEEPLDLEVICSEGQPYAEVRDQAFAGAPGGWPAPIGEAVATRQEIIGADFACVPVLDVMTHVPTAVLYFEREPGSAFGESDVAGLKAYAAALGHTLGLRGGFEAVEFPTESPRSDPTTEPEIVGTSDATRALLKQLQAYLPSVARPDAPPILVLGESGTGKELVARYLHQHTPNRRRAPFQAINCAALRGELAESRLFGHTRGAFTGAITETKGLLRMADGGVFFLDEIGELSAEGQALLLRVLENRTVQSLGATREIPVDVQIVVATNRNLEKEVAAGRFREDLYYRISGLRVLLKPLRHPERLGDIRPLLSFYLSRHERRLQKKTLGLTAPALRQLMQYAWPGNVRQLANACASLVTHVPAGEWIDVPHLSEYHPEILGGPRNMNPEVYIQDDAVSYGEAIRSFRKSLIMDRLQRFGGAPQAAASLGISEATFYRYWQDSRRIP
jgi:DNA-binding NtrC family response regulator